MTPADDEPRALHLEVEVPGTPEQVWEAIATGPGITAWMHPTEVEEHEGGSFSFDMGSGMDESGRVTGWDPPRRFAVDGVEWKPTEEMTPARLATEWIVEARAGGTCVVRLVTSGFGTGADWDAELEGFGESMRTALETLRLYLTHFPGRHGVRFSVLGRASGSRHEAWAASGSRHEAWAAFTEALGLADAGAGVAVTSDPGAPPLAGTVERVLTGARRRDLVLRVEAPAPGVAVVSVWGDRRWVNVQVHLYGDGAVAAAAREEPAWRAWVDARFPTDRPERNTS